MIDFQISPEHQTLQARVRVFIRSEIVPLESDSRQGPHGPEEDLRRELINRARRAGLLAPQVSIALGGMALTHVGRAIVFEESGYSPLGPVAMNLFAPDEGNMHLMEEIASPEQRERYLRPLVRGDSRSCFCMTEPAPGAGSDPSMLKTLATPDGNGWRLHRGQMAHHWCRRG